MYLSDKHLKIDCGFCATIFLFSQRKQPNFEKLERDDLSQSIIQFTFWLWVIVIHMVVNCKSNVDLYCILFDFWQQG